MLDPREGLTPAGRIRTGADLVRVPEAFKPAIDTARSEFERLGEDAELLLYGSVATGQARVGASDIDLIAAGATDVAAAELGSVLSERFAGLCRSVEVAPATLTGHLGPGDEAYGNRVFLRHYCVSLFGPDRLRGERDYPGDAAAARGFNGDIATWLRRWRELPAEPALGIRIARKSLLAVAGLVSVVDRIWTTDRRTGAERWANHRPELGMALETLLSWSDRSTMPSRQEVEQTLSRAGAVQAITDDFIDLIGAWDPTPSESS